MNKGYTSLNNKVIGGIKLGEGEFYILAINRLRSRLDKDCRDAKVIELMTKINLDTPMIVFKEDIRADRVLH